MLIYKSMFWISLVSMLLISAPMTESQTSLNLKSIRGENDSDSYPSLLVEGMGEKLSDWKSVVSDAIGVEESSLDLELAKEVFVEVMTWYADNLNDFYDRFPTLEDLQKGVFAQALLLVEKMNEQISGWKSAVSDAIGADESNLDLDLAKEILAEVAAWYADTLKDFCDLFPSIDLKNGIFSLGKKYLKF